MDGKKIEDYKEMLKICGDFMHHQNEYIKKLESQLITSRESQSAVPSEEYESLKDEYDRAVKEIGMSQDELKDANNEIRDLEYQIRQG